MENTKYTDDKIDIWEDHIKELSPELLDILLQDQTTGKNILWCTKDYEHLGSGYFEQEEIKSSLITGNYANIIQPRAAKAQEVQQKRIRDKAEVFTPSWVCNAMCNMVDNARFGRENVFNIESEKAWTSTKDKIEFPTEQVKKWTDYVELNCLEITCGEAPYLTSRYDTVSGNYIDVPERIGVLDRKLRVVSENTETEADWLEWATIAVQSTYGFEWQGDNLLIARENILFDVCEYFEHKFKRQVETSRLVEFAKIISWNIWQMDGLKFVIPNSCTTKEIIEEDLFEKRVVSKCCEGCKKKDYKKHNGIYCKIKDWKENEILRFVDMLEKDDKNG